MMTVVLLAASAPVARAAPETQGADGSITLPARTAEVHDQQNRREDRPSDGREPHGHARKIDMVKKACAAEKIAIVRPFVGPMMSKAAEPPPEPKAPPIPLKFYGFVNKTKVGDKRAFFLDGEDIVIAGEGDLIKKRYKIVRIGVNSAVVEDTEFHSNNQQTLPLEAELTG